MTLIKTSLLNGIAVLIKMATMLGINKVLAIYVGPAGYASIGQFQNAMQLVTTFTTSAINTGVTKYTAEYNNKEEEQIKIWRSAGAIAISATVIFSVAIIAFNDQLAILFLDDNSLSSVFTWFAIALIFFVLNTLLLAILNGKKAISEYVVSNIFGSLFALVVTSIMAVTLGLYGALVALATYQSLSFFITAYLIGRKSWFKFRYLIEGIDKGAAIKLSRFALMALTSAVSVPVSLILIRGHLTETIGIEYAGYWEAMWRLSGAYLMFVTTTLTLYYLPRLSEIRDVCEIKGEIKLGYIVVFPITAVAALVLFSVKDIVIQLLFSEDFLPMRELFFYQLLGDTTKIASWILGYVLTARAYVKVFIFSQIFFSFLFYILVIFFTEFAGFEGVAIAHFVNYCCHIVFMWCYLRQKSIL